MHKYVYIKWGALHFFIFSFKSSVRPEKHGEHCFIPETFPKHPPSRLEGEGYINCERRSPQGAGGRGGRVSHAAVSKAEVGPVRTGWRWGPHFNWRNQGRLSGAIEGSSGKRWRDGVLSIHGRERNSPPHALILHLVSSNLPTITLPLKSHVLPLLTSHQGCWNLLACPHFHALTALSSAQVHRFALQGTTGIESIWMAPPGAQLQSFASELLHMLSLLSVSFPVPLSTSLLLCVSH